LIYPSLSLHAPASRQTGLCGFVGLCERCLSFDFVKRVLCLTRIPVDLLGGGGLCVVVGQKVWCDHHAEYDRIVKCGLLLIDHIIQPVGKILVIFAPAGSGEG
jgi:hypothetical protein